MILILITLVFVFQKTQISAKSDFEILKNDSIFDGGTQGNKAFLKTQLLRNLNNFYPSINNGEKLEMLTGRKPEFEDDRERNQNFDGNSVTEPFPTQYPTLIPYARESNPEEELQLATAPTSKIRSEGRITSEQKMDSIRDFRMKLYKAFKNRPKLSRMIRKSNVNDVVEMNDGFPTIMDKNRQIILSRTEPNWQSLNTRKPNQTYGRDQNGNLIPLLGLEPAANFVDTKQGSPIEPYPPREIRYAYRTTNRQPVVYVPSASPVNQPSHASNTVPVAVASYLANPSSQPIQLHILPPIPSPQPQIIYQQTTPSSQFVAYSTFAPPIEPSNECGNGQCKPESDEDKCNSQRLRDIIFNNIVSGDAEASKRAVQSAAEAETGLFFDAICGTGFFSYIAHTDEFCLASSGGVNCYVFAPICQIDSQNQQKRTSKKLVKLSKN
ncbi:Ground-like domain-containing protein [Caenorhabditis elegans]|uniref:Ground-like domain-containing protein n=1 Tax=Caenorhabditis elegans TaxID=6239 RepID=H9G339_CAEEL|nr:Ground-like domain-containing protein [Caenorhabditis elegans]CCG28145.1 Ground-like domain-containing protein [Caenorhabditis elegans]|eukprot:NP_001256956.1 GRound-Like (grd related) [Caenorhabditis elegans]